jgi:uncharacterized protein YuzE
MIIKNGTVIVNDIYVTYLDIRLSVDVDEVVQRSVTLPNGLSVDVDEEGSIIGIEKVGDEIDFDDLVRILKHVRL